VYEHMIDLLRFMHPNASGEYLIQISNFCVLLGWFLICLVVLGTSVEAVAQRKIIYEGFPLIFIGLFLVIPMGIHSNISVTNFFYYFQLLIPIP
jgi:hypothetical protein